MRNIDRSNHAQRSVLSVRRDAAVLRCCGAAVSSNDEGRMRGPRVTAPAKQSVSLWRRRNAESVG